VLFDVRTVHRGGWDVVQVVGDVDLATVPTLQAALVSAVGERVALDLVGVDHFDPLGFGVVLSASLRTTRRGARFAVLCSGRPRELFVEAGVDRIVEVAGSIDELERSPGSQSR
jgi:anti-sigma B factor antagonist